MRQRLSRGVGPSRREAARDFGQERLMAPETIQNPMKRGIRTALNRMTVLDVDGTEIPLTTTNIACLAAIASGKRYTYEITKAYEWKHGTVLYSLRSLHSIRGLIELDETSGDKGAEPSVERPQLKKSIFRLTGLGEAAVKKLRETSVFFAECEAWLRAEDVRHPGKPAEVEKPAKKPATEVAKPDAASPIAHGMESKKLVFLDIHGESVPLTNTQVACLVAVSRGFDYTYAVTKAFRWKHATIRNALLTLHAISRLIEPDCGSTGTRYSPSDSRANLSKIVYKLTEKGKAALKELKKTKNEFYAECNAWLRKRK